ncbi:MAG: 2Fe-2S iron-sulfur cluster-binding protein [Polyangia bacterium]|jgi:formate dehydrogenase major subunit/NADH-quinone oxidoreductase subunit G|nr:2Fe-2S iron-sulfur cluster-binding protein [Polyangia bacterium]
MTEATFTIDGQTVTAPEGQKLLWAAEAAGIFIPHLCAHPDHDPPFASCRLCFVEIAGRSEPVTACTEPVKDGLIVRTRSDRVDRLVRSGLHLLMSTHDLDCRACPARHRCGLRQIARRRRIGLRSGDPPPASPGLPRDDSHPRLGLDPNRCVLCGLCVWMCEEVVGRGLLHFASRGPSTRVSTFGGLPLVGQCPLDEGCSARCASVCPVGALYLK